MKNCIIYCKWAVTTSVDSLPDSYYPSLRTKAWIHQTVLPLCRIMFMFTRENKLLLLLLLFTFFYTELVFNMQIGHRSCRALIKRRSTLLYPRALQANVQFVLVRMFNFKNNSQTGGPRCFICSNHCDCNSKTLVQRKNAICMLNLLTLDNFFTQMFNKTEQKYL